MLTGASFASAVPATRAQEPPPPAEQRPFAGRPGGMPGRERPLQELFFRIASLPPDQQEAALAQDELFQRLAPEMQQMFLQRLERFNQLPAEERESKLGRWREQRERRRTAETLFLRVAALPPEEQQQALAGDEFFRVLPPEIQERFRCRLERFDSEPAEHRQQMLDRLRRFSELPQDEQAKLRKRARQFAEMSPEQRQQAQQLFGQWRQLAPERRRLLAERLERLRQVSPEDRQALLANPDFFSPLDVNEQQLLQNLSRLRQAMPARRPRGPGALGPPPH